MLYYLDMEFIGNNKTLIFLIGIFLMVQAGVLWFFGQPFFCTCGEVKLWEGVVFSAGNSQQLTDWYTPSHVIHGFLFYGLFSLLFPRLPRTYRLLMSLGLEISWEIMENTPWIIGEYRKQTLASLYMGDSIFNSLSDSFAMMSGFFLASRLPVKWSIALVLAAEILVGYAIHDNLTLNILNFVYPVEFVRDWQNSGS